MADLLEPVMARHRLVVDPRLIREDARLATSGDENQRFHSWGFQMARLTRERDCLRHDDALDALAQAVGWWIHHMAVDVDKAASQRLDEEREKAVQDFLAKVRTGKALILNSNRGGRPSRRPNLLNLLR